MQVSGRNARKQPVKAKSKNRVLLIIIICVGVVLLSALAFVGLKEFNYRKATSNLEQGNYAVSQEAFAKLNTYRDSETKEQYSTAYLEVDKENFKEAIRIFESINCPQEVEETKLLMAENFILNENFIEAIDVYEELGNADKINEGKFAYAEYKYQNGNVKDAYLDFASLEDFGEASSMADNLREEIEETFIQDVSNLEMPSDTDYEAYSALFNTIDDYVAQASNYGIDLPTSIESSVESLITEYEISYFENYLLPSSTFNEDYISTAGIATDEVKKNVEDKISNPRFRTAEHTGLVLYWYQESKLDNEDVYVKWYYYGFDSETNELVQSVWMDEVDEAFSAKRSDYWYLGWYGDDATTWDAGIYSVELILVETGEPIATQYFSVDRSN